MSGWIGVDYDGTLKRLSDGEPVPAMVAKIKSFIAAGAEVRILTARVATYYPPEHRESTIAMIQQWCVAHLGQALRVTSEKDYDMLVLFDDRAVAVKTDTGECKGYLEVGVEGQSDT